jgi:murein DD-endopeptidase MepM/ murein hydrolase activator NlpD
MENRRKLRQRLLGAVLAVVALPVAGPAAAAWSLARPSAATTTTTTAPKGATATTNPSLRNQVEFATPDELALLDKIDAATQGLANLTAQLANADNLVAERQLDFENEQQHLLTLEQQVAADNDHLEVVHSQIADLRDDIRRRALASYIGEPQLRMANLALQVQGAGDLAVTMGYLQVVVDTQDRDLHHLDALKTDVSGTEDDIKGTGAAVDGERSTVENKRNAADNAKNAEQQLGRQALEATQQAAALHQQLTGDKSVFAAQLAVLDAESAGITALLRSIDGSHANVTYGRGVVTLPIPGAPITSPFGPRLDPILGIIKVHTGIDLGAAEGTPIRAAADGTVVTAGVVDGYGNCTVIDHGNGLATLYGHQSQLLVTPGQQVHKGDIIGLVGHTGFATGPHLHFEVRVDGVPVDPIPYL